MSDTDELKDALFRLQQACADVLRLLDARPQARPEDPPATPGLKDPAPKNDIVISDPAPEPPPKPDAPSAAGVDDLYVRLRKLGESARAEGVDPEDLTFAERAGQMDATFPPPKKLRLASDCARLLDELLWNYHFLLSKESRRAAAELVRELTGKAGESIDREEVRVPASSSAGSEVADVSPARRAVSSGSTSAGAETFLEVVRETAAADAKDPGARATALKELMNLWPRLAGADAAKESTVLRYAVNAVGDLGLSLESPLIGLLEKQGIREIPVQIGSMFDDSYGPGRYERRKVRSREPRNSIVRVVQRGFLGVDGVPLQRVVVAVSDGEG